MSPGCAECQPSRFRGSGRSRPGGGSRLAALPPAPAGWQHGGVDYVLAQVNVARMREPLDSPLLADFVSALAFTLREHFPRPDVAGPGPVLSPEEWTCPA
jgi:hypothetical protein